MSAKTRRESDWLRFDRVAEHYDETRALSPEAMRATLDLLGRELRDRGTCLDIGVGTGRIAVPLHDEGVELVGLDISEAMLAKLVEKGGGRAPFSIVRADATALPFADASMGAGLAVHVLHLIEAWHQAVLELVRVVRPGGVVLVNLPRDSEHKPWNEVNERFREVAGLPPEPPGMSDPHELDEFLRSRGATPRELPSIPDRSSVTIAELIRRLGDGVYSCTWRLDEDARQEAAGEVRTWAEEKYGTATKQPIELISRWRAYDLA